MHLSPEGHVECRKLLCATGFWWRYWWKSRLLGMLEKSFKKLSELLVYLSVYWFRFQIRVFTVGTTGSSQLMDLCVPSSRFQTWAWVKTWICTSLLPPHPKFQKPAWAGQRGAVTCFACSSNWKKRRSCLQGSPQCQHGLCYRSSPQSWALHTLLQSVLSFWGIRWFITQGRRITRYKQQLSPCSY